MYYFSKGEKKISIVKKGGIWVDGQKNRTMSVTAFIAC